MPAAASGADHACARVPEPERRLACYDAAFPPTPEVREHAARSALDAFGKSSASVPPLVADAPGADPRRITSKVTNVTHHSSGRTITLENGQVWVVTEATSRGQMQSGDEVEVRRAAMGSFLLVTAAGVSLRVRRLR